MMALGGFIFNLHLWLTRISKPDDGKAVASAIVNTMVSGSTLALLLYYCVALNGCLH